MSTNPPSFRLPVTLPEDVHPAVKDAIRLLFNGFTNHEQAFKALKTQTTAATAAAAATPATGSVTIIQETAPNVIGGTSDQSGVTSYILQQTDYGAFVTLASASPVSLTLNSGVTKPFFCRLFNNGAGTVTMASGNPDGSSDGNLVNGAASKVLAANATIFVYFDSADNNWTVR